MWAMAMLLAAVACWRTARRVAIVLAGLGRRRTRRRGADRGAAGRRLAELRTAPRRLLLAYAASLVIAAPAIVLVFLTPAFTDAALV